MDPRHDQHPFHHPQFQSMEAVDVFLTQAERRQALLPQEAQAVRQVIGEFDAAPQDLRDLLALLARNRDIAARDFELRHGNPYVNSELGPVRWEYVKLLKERLRKAQSILETVKAIAVEYDAPQTWGTEPAPERLNSYEHMAVG